MMEEKKKYLGGIRGSAVAVYMGLLTLMASGVAGAFDSMRNYNRAEEERASYVKRRDNIYRPGMLIGFFGGSFGSAVNVLLRRRLDVLED